MDTKTNSAETGINPCNRREFLKKSSLAGILLSFSGLGLASAKGLFPQPAQAFALGSGFNIFSIAVIDDCVQLVMQSDKINPLLKQSLPSDLNMRVAGTNPPHPGNTARLASVLDFNKEDYISLLANAREKKGSLDEYGADRQKLGFALGWVISHAGNQHLKDFKTTAGQAFSESNLYLDATILRAKSAGKGAIAKPEDVQSLFHQMAPRIFTRFHTFIPDTEDGPGWVLLMAEWRENLKGYFNNLAVAYAKPDPAKVKKYITGPGVYNPNDQVIKLVRSLEAKKGGVTADTERAANAKATSQYAKAIAEGYRHIKTASDFFEGRINEKQLSDSLA